MMTEHSDGDRMIVPWAPGNFHISIAEFEEAVGWPAGRIVSGGPANREVYSDQSVVKDFTETEMVATSRSNAAERIVGAELADIYEKVVERKRLSFEDGVRLYTTRNLSGVGYLANLVRERMNGDRAYYIRNQHINYTNICNKHCKFCYFAKNPKEGGPDPYLFSMEDVRTALRRHRSVPITEVHMVGGINPRLPYSYYLELLQTVREERPGIHIKAFTAVELVEIERVAQKPLAECLEEMKAAGLTSIPGGGAEVMSERLHGLLHPKKIGAEGWKRVAREIAAAGLPQYATMLYGHIETLEERVDHLVQLRELQDELGHFLAFTPLSFHPEATYLDYLPGPTGQDDLRNLAVSRLMLDNFAHIKSFWIMNTAEISQLSLWYGADDIDGTIHVYEITYPEGHIGEKKQVLTRRELLENIREAGRTPVERDSLYDVVPERGEAPSRAISLELQPA
jgi:aminodeoxyfutalosine synthase